VAQLFADSMLQRKSMMLLTLAQLVCSRRQTIDRTVSANKAKPIDISKQGLNSIKNKIVKQNLMGVSESMSKKGWKDSQGRSGKVR
jgi:hypothetical protein